jgi:hypothetical protein
MKRTALILVLSIVCSPLPAAVVLYEKSAPSVVDSAVLVAEHEFSQSRLEGLAREFLETHEALPVKKLSLFVDSRAEVRARFGKAMSHPSYYDSQLRREAGDKLPTVAEVLAFRGSAVLRARMPDGSLWSKVLNRSDPLRIKLPGIDAEILYVHFHEWGFNRSALAIQIFVRLAAELSPDKAERIAAALWKDIPYSDVVVHVRNDEWFIESEGYPWTNPFLPVSPLPSYKQFSKTKEYYCSVAGGKGCMEFGLMYPVPSKGPDAAPQGGRPR